MEHVYPIEGKPFFYSEGYSGLRFWLNGYWNIRDGYLHGIHWNTRDERSYKKGKSYYVYYKGNCVYMWFDDKKGNHLNGYNLYEKRTSYSLDSAFLKGKNLTMSFSNLTTTPIRVPNLYGRTIEYNLKDLNPEHYWQSNDTLYVSISDSSNRNEFIWETKVGGYKQRYKPYQFTIADRMIENVLLPNENVSYRLKIDLKEPPHFLAFQYVNRIDCLRISIIE